MRSAEVIAVGSEMLGSTRTDTNSLYVADRLSSIGIDLRVKTVVGDERDDLASVVRQALDRVDVVVLTGGLGPTDDDLTRDVVAEVLERPMSIDESIVAKIRARFERRGLTMPEVNRRQALVPRGAAVLDNPNGTAPGLFIEHAGARGPQAIVLLPGPPREMQPMLDRVCRGPLGALAGGERTYRTSLFLTGRGESHVEQKVQPIYSRWRDEQRPIVTTILAAMGQIELHLSVRDSDEARARSRLARARDELLAVIGEDIYSTDGRVMEEVVGDLLKSRGYTVAAAESCTGGLFSSRLTDVAGSSAYVRCGVVAYANEEKTSLIGVSAELIAAHGAVSEPVAVAMAEGIRERSGADVAVGITGIAGPGGGTPEKPVGTVAIAVIVRNQPAYVRTYQFIGGRAMVKFQATQAAMDRIRRMLLSDDR
ncbi:MAG TPA: competence/damage-inducible protein A [Vicinamibacterales bacterium]|jgi:nicotinamide-nucleotide amidase|nr:competence/damage-inducible protein A [Vicinamibacterales bacterium]